MRKTCWRFLMTALLPTTLAAQAGAPGIVGTWQGMVVEGQRTLRKIVRVAPGRDRRLGASLVRADEGEGFDREYAADTVLVEGRKVTLVWTAAGVRFVGRVGAGGRTLRGTWTDGTDDTTVDLARATPRTAWRDSAPHARRFVQVGPGVRLEVLDWGPPRGGGAGRPLVLLAGNGNTGHVYDEFAAKLAPEFHVYAVTRRGFGRSSAPSTGYLADTLADDVLAVLDSLRIRRPVLVGHSLAGQELSSIGSRRPDRVAGLVYLDAGYPFAFFDPAQTNWSLSVGDAQRKLLGLVDPAVPMSVAERRAAITELLQTSLPLVERDLRAWEHELAARPNQSARPPAETDPVERALALGHQKYTDIRAPTLAIFAFPRQAPSALARDPAARARIDSLFVAAVGPQVAAFERGIPGARVVRLAHADHYVFRSHEADVLREIREFVAGLPDGR